MGHFGPADFIALASIVATIAMAWVARGQNKHDGFDSRQNDHERRITVLETETKNISGQLGEVKVIVNKIDEKITRVVEKQNAPIPFDPSSRSR